MSDTTTRPETDAERILAGIRDMYDAFLDRDRTRFDRHLATELTVWESHLPAMLDRQQLDDYRDGRGDDERPDPVDLRVEPQQVDVWGDRALARYLLVIVGRADGRETGTTRVTDVLERGPDGWRIVHHHAEQWTARP